MSKSLTLVFGLGDTGLSCIRKLYGKVDLAAVDTRLPDHEESIANLPLIKRQFPNLALHTVTSATRILSQTSRMVVSPGISLGHCLITEAESHDVEIVGDIDLFMESLDVPVYGVTGTNGKSTTTALIGEMLDAHGVACGGNFGTPALDLLDMSAERYVLEVSSFQLERWHSGSFDVAVLLNVSEDHLDRHRSFQKYVECKRRVFRDCGFAVYDGTDPRCAPDKSVPAIALNRDPDWRVVEDGVVVAGHFIDSEKIALRGAHNHLNLVAAAAVAMHAGADFAEIRNIASCFKGLPHRAQCVAEADGVSFINDSKATNVGAAIATIEGLSQGRKNIILIAGGDGKKQSFDPLAATSRSHVKKIVAIGRDGPLVAAAVPFMHAEFAASMKEAVMLATKTARAGDIVLLAPCCASYDMYDGFAARGNDFSSVVWEQVNG